MIQSYSRLDVADNTGAKVAMCIKVLGGTRRRYAGVGDVIVASVKKSAPGSDVKQGDVVRGVIIRTKHNVRRPDGTCVRFDRNAMVILDAENNPKGDPDLWCRGSGAETQELHEDHLPRFGSGLTGL